MISKVLISLTNQLNDYLKLYFRLQEDIVFLSPIQDANNSYPSNRLSLSVVNIEREAACGIRFESHNVSEKVFRKTAPTWHINVYLLIAAVFLEKQYSDSIQILSGTMSFIQKNTTFQLQGSAFSYTIEPVNMSFHELSNLWSLCGGVYYPSILCKIRMFDVDEKEILDLSPVAAQQDLNSGIKKQ